MKVGICYTKNSVPSRKWVEAFKEGVQAHGDEIEEIKTTQEATRLLPDCDISFQSCEATAAGYAPEDKLRNVIQKIQDEKGARRIVLDTPLIPTPTDPHVSIGYDGIKGAAIFHNENSPPDRKNLRNIKLKPWNSVGKNIVIICQTFCGAGLRHEDWEEVKEYYIDLPKRIRQYTDRPIVFRLHPNQRREGKFWRAKKDEKRIQNSAKNLTLQAGKRSGKGGGGIEKTYSSTYCTITRTSAGCIGALIAGIPSISEDDNNIANAVCERDLSNIESIIKPDRNQWVNNLCYAEWNIEEIKAGRCWKHLRPHVNKDKDEFTKAGKSMGLHAAVV